MAIFYTVAVLIVIILSAIAAYYVVLVLKQKRQLETYNKQQEQQLTENREKVNNSIQILARGVVQDQLTLTEASIRISTLLEILSVGADVREEYSAFYLLAEKTSHIPILEQWKNLNKKEQLRFDLERQELEYQYSDEIHLAAKRILGKAF